MPLDWQAKSLWQSLAAILPGLTVEVLAEAGSTNSVLLERAHQGDTRPCLLVAEHQSAGRGRLGRVWQSAPGSSLTFSLGLRLAPADWSGLSLAVGLALAEALEPDDLTPKRVALKWPNDLLLRDERGPRKVCGILVETVSTGAANALSHTGAAITANDAGPTGRYAVVGVGLNILPQAVSRSAAETGLGSGYACLHELNPAIDAPMALAQVGPPLLRALLAFEREGFAPLRQRFAARDLLLHQAVRTSVAGLTDAGIEGIADGVDERGVLWLKSGGRRVAVSSGEVSVRTAGMARWSVPAVGGVRPPA